MRDPERHRDYDRFARFYNLYWAEGYLKEVEYGLEERILPLLAPGSRALDLCCGTGQLAAWLAARGFEVTGLDGSEEMLRLARQNAPDAKLVLADAREFEVEERFDLVISTFDSMNHLPTLEDLEQVFRCVRAALAPEGYFFFDVNTNEGFEYAGDESYAISKPEHVCVVEAKYDAKRKQGASRITVFLPEGDLWRRTDVEIPEYCYNQLDVEAALARAGFDNPKILRGDEDMSMARGEGRLFFLARPR